MAGVLLNITFIFIKRKLCNEMFGHVKHLENMFSKICKRPP